MKSIIPWIIVTALIFIVPAFSQLSETESWSVDLVNRYRVIPNITYSVAGNVECKLDVYARRDVQEPLPTVLCIHGGGWVTGSKEGAFLSCIPWMTWGWNIVNVEYRLLRTAPAPAAVEDCRHALRWIFKNAKEYGFDTTRLAVTGGSAGGHLALMTGMLKSTDGFDAPRDWDQNPLPIHVSAIINWFGITDVADLLNAPNRQQYAVSWFGSMNNPKPLAERVSPLTYVRKDTPPILSIHGDADQLVPYQHAVRLHWALKEAGVKNQLITIPGGKHGGFTHEEMADIFSSIKKFLSECMVLPKQ